MGIEELIVWCQRELASEYKMEDIDVVLLHIGSVVEIE